MKYCPECGVKLRQEKELEACPTCGCSLANSGLVEWASYGISMGIARILFIPLLFGWMLVSGYISTNYGVVGITISIIGFAYLLFKVGPKILKFTLK